MSTTKVSRNDMKFEIVVIPVSDADRAKEFYGRLGWRLDADFAGGDDFRVIQFTPPGSGCSVIFGKNVTAAVPGSAQGLYLGWRADGNQFSMIENCDPLAQPGGLIEIVRGKQDRPPLLPQVLNDIVYFLTRLRIKAGRGLIEEDQHGIINQGQRQRQALLLPARQSFVFGVTLLPKAQTPEKDVYIGIARITNGKQPNHFDDPGAVCDSRILKADPNPVFQLVALDRGIKTENGHRAGGDTAKAFKDFYDGSFSSAVGSEQSEDFAFLDIKVHAVNSAHVAVRLAKTANDDRGG